NVAISHHSGQSVGIATDGEHANVQRSHPLGGLTEVRIRTSTFDACGHHISDLHCSLLNQRGYLLPGPFSDKSKRPGFPAEFTPAPGTGQKRAKCVPPTQEEVTRVHIQSGRRTWIGGVVSPITSCNETEFLNVSRSSALPLAGRGAGPDPAGASA